ncbi:uncharacterized protein L201_007799 [Kwoniella dendrophila CBS 6074]|uniref:Uncharacterized protein n=1 Tax=Kwoniella dendrophila CBS 6074 TaxID=1295534 RepID=A0AAX4K6T8_9TREE
MRPIRTIRPLLRKLPASTPIRSLITPLTLSSPSSSHTQAIRLYSQITRRGPSAPPGYPSDTEYSDSTVYAFSYISRVIKYMLYGILGLGGMSLAAFEGLHFYVENVCLAAPSRDGTDDPYGWIGENQGWTGGSRGGTDPRLGQKARHALRGAWICQEWGAGGSASSTLSKSITGGGSGTTFHPDYVAVKGMIGNTSIDSTNNGGRQSIDRGYELAEEFINLAINEARRKGLVFPPNLSTSSSLAVNSGGPPINQKETHGIPQGDPVVLDLFLLKAGILERINTTDSLLHAKELYQQVLNSMNHSQDEQHLHNQARIMKLSNKLGDLSKRTGQSDQALQWWSWGLNKANIQLNTAHQPVKDEISDLVKEVKSESKSWFGFGGSKTKTPKESESTNTTTTTSPTTPPTTEPSSELTPAILRAAVSLLVSASAHYATTSSLNSASSLQSQALSLIPQVPSISTPTSTSAGAVLHQTWLQHRLALLKLHQASVIHAQNSKPNSVSPEALNLISESTSISENLINQLQNLPVAYTTPKSSSVSGPAKLLRRDVLLTGAESSYTKAVFLERSAPWPDSTNPKERELRINQLEQSAELYERAMSLNVIESGIEKKDNDEIGQGEDWGKYWRGYVRVRGKLGNLVDQPKSDSATKTA